MRDESGIGSVLALRYGRSQLLEVLSHGLVHDYRRIDLLSQSTGTSRPQRQQHVEMCIREP
jgi:hypothetical protein